MKALTPRQKQLYGFIREYQDTHGGVPPTIKEMAQELEHCSTNSAFGVLRAIVRKGWVWQIGAMASRGYTTYEPRCEPSAPYDREPTA